MIYPEGKPGSRMTDEVLYELQKKAEDARDSWRQRLGSKWLLHKDNMIKKMSKPSVLSSRG